MQCILMIISKTIKDKRIIAIFKIKLSIRKLNKIRAFR